MVTLMRNLEPYQSPCEQLNQRVLALALQKQESQVALLVPRATPIDSHLPSPAELLYGRSVVSNLPVATWNASGKGCEIRARLDQRQATAKGRHDARGVRDLAELSPGEHIRTRHPQMGTRSYCRAMPTVSCSNQSFVGFNGIPEVAFLRL